MILCRYYTRDSYYIIKIYQHDNNMDIVCDNIIFYNDSKPVLRGKERRKHNDIII